MEPKERDFTIPEGGKPIKFVFRATVPLICQGNVERNCYINVKIITNKDVFTKDSQMCDVVFKPGGTNQTQTIELYAKTDFRTDGDQTAIMRSVVLPSMTQSDWFTHHDLPHKRVRTDSLL